MAGGNNYGPRLDNRQRGNATQLLEKYRALARDAQQAGDRVTAEYYLQYAEHYYRVLGDYRDRQPEGRRGRDSFDDDALDADVDAGDSGDDEAGDEAEAGDTRDPRPNDRRDRRDDRPRDNRPRDNRPREERPRDDRPRDDRPRDDRPRDERGRDERQGDDRAGDDRGQERRRDWQRDRRERRPERADRQEQRAEPDGGDDRESLLQALPPPATMPSGETGSRRLGLKRERADAVEAPAPEPVSEAEAPETGLAPKRRGRPRKAAAESAAE